MSLHIVIKIGFGYGFKYVNLLVDANYGELPMHSFLQDLTNLNLFILL